jgi:uncharacterized repeat protein (TIGR02543 family)
MNLSISLSGSLMRNCSLIRSFCIVGIIIGLNVNGVWGQISITTSGLAYTENFNTLASSGTSSTLPAGWSFIESGTNASTSYNTGTGSSNTGDTYSFGATNSTDRALGTLLTGSLTSTIGATYTNNTGSTITQLIISYYGEQWKLGAENRLDKLIFEYSLNATGLAVGNWNAVTNLDFIAPKTTGTGASDGNNASNRTLINYTITGLSISNGSTFWIRFRDYDATGSDDGLGIDDWSLTPITVPHTVTFNNNNGTGSMSDQISDIATNLSTNTFTRTGYTFNGWNTNANGNGTAYTESQIYSFSNDITLFAQWTQNALVENPSIFTSTAVSSNQINFSTTANSNSDNIVVVTNGTGIFTTPTNGVIAGNNGESFAGGTILYKGSTLSLPNHNELTANITYYYKVFSYDGSNNYSSGISRNTTTLLTTWIEDFENGTKGGYATEDVTCTKGSWNMTDALLGATTSDIKNGIRSVRIQGTGELKMNSDKTNGAGTITIYHAKFGTDNSSRWKLQLSINGGTNWIDVGTTVNTTSTTLSAQNYTINQSGNIRFKIVKLSGDKLNIDDITITDYSSPSSSLWTGAVSNDWNLALNWNNGTPGNTTSVTVAAATNSPIINNFVEIPALTIQQNAALTIAAANRLTVQSSLSNDGTLNLLSYSSGTATILTPATIVSSGTSTVNQALNYRTWYISSPVTSAIPTGMNRIKYYNEYDNTWMTTVSNLEIGKGYLAVPNSTDISGTSFSGTLNNGNIPVTLTSSPKNIAKQGFNLVGNPYPSYLDWTKVAGNANNSSVLETSTIWYRTKQGGVYTFWTVNGSGIGSPAEASYLIPPMQAFWVKAKSGGGTLNFTNEMRSHNTTGNSIVMKAPSAEPNTNQLLRLQVSNGTNTDETVLYFNSNASDGLDTYDSPKMNNENADIPEIYTTVENNHLVINGMNSIDADKEIALGIAPGAATALYIQATEMSNIPADTKILLLDKKLNSSSELITGTTLPLPDASASTNRYSILFKSAGITSSVNKVENNKPTISVYKNANNQISITLNDDYKYPGYITIFNSLGQELINQKLTSKTTVINRSLPGGVYFVKTSIGVTKTIQKLVIN